MYCPRCGSNQSDELKFCKLCGANLYAVRQVVATRETEEKTDPAKTWLDTMSLYAAAGRRIKEEMDHPGGLTPEVRRYNEIKAGVITGSVGLGFMIFLYFLMQGIILSGRVPQDTGEILSVLWVAGVIPLFVGIALIINGVFVSKRQAEIARQAGQTGAGLPERDTNPLALNSAEQTEFIPSAFSVTEETTKHLKGSGQKQ